MPDYNNKVVFGEDVLMDISEDTVTPQTLLSGETAHDRSGAPITGTAVQGHVIKDSNGSSMTQRQNLKFVNASVTDDSENNQTIVNVGADASTYSTNDSASTTINDTDYVPMSDANGNRKKSLWSNIVDKLKMLFYKKFVSTWTYNVQIVSSNGSGQLIWIFTGFGLIEAQTSGNTIYIAGNAVKNYANWTYSRDGLTLTLNCTDHTPMLIIASDNNIDVTFTDVSTRQANNLTEYTYISIPRVAQSANALPDAASVRFREYTAGANYNLPSNDWYQILEIRSQDTNYGTQLALGMTVDRAYYRRYGGGSWGSWHSIIDTNTWRGIQNNLTSDSTSDSLSAAQGKALANGSARDNTKLPLTGGEMTGELAFANNTWNSVGDDCYMGDKNVAGAVCFKGITGNTTLRLIQHDGIDGANITFNGSKIIIDTLDPYVAVSVSGRTITLTKQSGGTSTITTQDTTYSIAQYGNTPANLAEFVRYTATGALFSTFKIKDANNVLGLGADWIKGWIQYQNAYGGQYSVGGVGLASTQSCRLYKIVITGANPFTVTSREL